MKPWIHAVLFIIHSSFDSLHKDQRVLDVVWCVTNQRS